MPHIICVCRDCSTIYLGGQDSLYCPDCRVQPRNHRKCFPIRPDLWDPIAVANHHPGGSAAQVWDRIEKEARA